MSDETEPVAKRGDAAWKQQLSEIAARNEQARKAARQRRGAEDQKRAVARRVEERRAMDEAAGQHPAR